MQIFRQKKERFFVILAETGCGRRYHSHGLNGLQMGKDYSQIKLIELIANE